MCFGCFRPWCFTSNSPFFGLGSSSVASGSVSALYASSLSWSLVVLLLVVLSVTSMAFILFFAIIRCERRRADEGSMLGQTFGFLFSLGEESSSLSLANIEAYETGLLTLRLGLDSPVFGFGLTLSIIPVASSLEGSSTPALKLFVCWYFCSIVAGNQVRETNTSRVWSNL